MANVHQHPHGDGPANNPRPEQQQHAAHQQQQPHGLHPRHRAGGAPGNDGVPIHARILVPDGALQQEARGRATPPTADDPVVPSPEPDILLDATASATTTPPAAPAAGSLVDAAELPEAVVRERNVYVAELPLSFTADHFAALMGQFGPITSYRLFNSTRRVRHSGRVYGFCLYQRREDAEQAAAGLDGLVVEGRAIAVRRSANGVVREPPPRGAAATNKTATTTGLATTTSARTTGSLGARQPVSTTADKKSEAPSMITPPPTTAAAAALQLPQQKPTGPLLPDASPPSAAAPNHPPPPGLHNPVQPSTMSVPRSLISGAAAAAPPTHHTTYTAMAPQPAVFVPPSMGTPATTPSSPHVFVSAAGTFMASLPYYMLDPSLPTLLSATPPLAAPLQLPPPMLLPPGMAAPAAYHPVWDAPTTRTWAWHLCPFDSHTVRDSVS